MEVWTTQVRRWPMVIVIAFGQISNILNVLVLARSRLRKNACSRYLLGASVSNAICICSGIFTFVTNNGFGYSFQAKWRFLCKLLPFLYYSTLFLASWFILLACIDRYCSTHSKVHIRRLSHIRIANWVLTVLPFLSFLVHIHLLIFIDWTQPNICSFVVFDYLLFFYVYYVTIYAFLTPILYVIFALLTIHNVRKTKRAVALVRRRNGTVLQPRKRQQTLDAQLLRMLLVQVISFVALTMPLAAWNVYAGVSYYWSKSARTLSLEALLSSIFRLLTFVSIGSTFVVYTSTARLFREELQALFRCQWFRNVLGHQQHSRVFVIYPTR